LGEAQNFAGHNDVISWSAGNKQSSHICLNMLDGLQPKIKTFFFVTSLRTAGKRRLTQRRHYLALWPHQMLPKQPDVAACTCRDESAEETHEGGRRERRLPRGTGAEAAAATACGGEEDSEGDLAPQRGVLSIRYPLIHGKKTRILHSALFTRAKERQQERLLSYDEKKSQHSREESLASSNTRPHFPMACN